MVKKKSVTYQIFGWCRTVPPRKREVFKQTSFKEVCRKKSLQSALLSNRMVRLITRFDTPTGEAHAPEAVSNNDTVGEIVSQHSKCWWSNWLDFCSAAQCLNIEGQLKKVYSQFYRSQKTDFILLIFLKPNRKT